MDSASLQGGFADPAPQAATAFRAILNAMARPGRIETVAGAAPPAPLSPAAGAVLLTLCDADTGLYLAGDTDTEAVRDWVRFHLGAPLTGPGEAAFALGRWAALQPLSAYPAGTPDYPDRSTTLIVEMDGLSADGATLRGPGIRDTARLSLPETAAFRANRRLFPLGLDFIFTAGAQVAALPRSTEVG
ncbi:phosphonate C-P lyase system protein PhnH [Psychromarinibacter sp. C21-152]|uniref:Phosphonate C-P lyase system protein PhnH n=1 Tax=Psychromarinibacter sediminicola TaxID=3033385 RepID=A0AAE3NRJ6_9RHOB|nr:phosphonate C-P lyase system protein PhnH [Psychromarinibacter sediminicola]MDF0601131.1 phosphonate C-P lyase system protein PhnH [Psychromarinibacter sediminicola]